MHPRKIEITCVGRGLCGGDLAEARQAQPPGTARRVCKPYPPAENGDFLLVGRDFHPRLDAVQRVDDGEAIEAGFFDPIDARAPGRLEADRPRLLALFAQIEEM